MRRYRSSHKESDETVVDLRVRGRPHELNPVSEKFSQCLPWNSSGGAVVCVTIHSFKEKGQTHLQPVYRYSNRNVRRHSK